MHAAACVCAFTYPPSSRLHTAYEYFGYKLHVHRLYFTSSDEEGTTQLEQFVADEGDTTDQEEASS